MEENEQTYFDREYGKARDMREFELMLRGEKNVRLHLEHPEHIYSQENLNEYRARELDRQRHALCVSVEYLQRDFVSRFYHLEGVTDATLKIAIDRLNQALDQIPQDLVAQENAFKEWRRYLIEVIKALQEEMARREGVKGTKQQADDLDLVREQVRKFIEAEQKLMQDCEEEIAKYPEQEAQIRRIYRRAIDRLREQQ